MKATKGKAKSNPKKPAGIALAAAFKSFMGHLEGSGKARHTVDAYRFDLQSFAEFLEASRSSKSPLDLRGVLRRDLERYHDWLKQAGLKTNTRRRRLMTVRKLMNYLTNRKKLDLDVAKRLPAPEKIERVPETLDLARLRTEVATLDTGSPLARRNLALLGLLMDTGCTVSEAAGLRWSAVDAKAGTVRFYPKGEGAARDLRLSAETLAAFARLRESAGADELCFLGFNRHGPMRVGKRALGITPRGIELLVKSVAGGLGYAKVTPRTLRHSAVVEWFRAGASEEEIQRRLGLRTPYAFRIYAPIFAAIRDGRSKSSSGTTSTA
ncbi:MAG: tyrosine-type recombinase/integrase [Bdellovibrionales bacterium]|nr:tyrosine-type recombinase/integrase [Bdellovibrionales bacterium]